MAKLKTIIGALTLTLLFALSATALAAKPEQTVLHNPVGNDSTTIAATTQQITRQILGIVGVLVMIYFFYGGWEWFTARGQSQKIEHGQKTMIYAVLGLIVIFSSYAILDYVLSIFFKK